MDFIDPINFAFEITEAQADSQQDGNNQKNNSEAIDNIVRLHLIRYISQAIGNPHFIALN